GIWGTLAKIGIKAVPRVISMLKKKKQ
uniref:M-poneritoxin-Ng1c n=1 Tax=Neoponera goeldii TaxID=3057131 RepID=WTX1C_NEOGO|nr:RecName: Full=M-poneritoxin-Ng1c; Short=M-PONTX-Ng1c; AltName: Full=Poneratoxin; AltName: Full=Ponericin-W3 [Neoponera goeldii]